MIESVRWKRNSYGDKNIGTNDKDHILTRRKTKRHEQVEIDEDNEIYKDLSRNTVINFITNQLLD